MTKTRSRGFTLIELLVVAAIIAMAAFLTVPSIGDTVKGRRLRGAEDSIRGAILTARSAAIARRTIYCVDFAFVARKIYIQDPYGRFLEKGVDLPDLVEFDPDPLRTTVRDVAADSGSGLPAGNDLPAGYVDDPDTFPDLWFGPDGTVIDTAGFQIGVREKGATSPAAEPKKYRLIGVNRWTGMTQAR